MFEILMMIGIFLIVIAIVTMVELNNNIKQLLEKERKQEENSKKDFKRTHTPNSRVNFSNVLNGRTDAYDKYKNKDGLFEPVKTKNGIEIKPRKEN